MLSLGIVRPALIAALECVCAGSAYGAPILSVGIRAGAGEATCFVVESQTAASGPLIVTRGTDKNTLYGVPGAPLSDSP